MDTGYTIVVGDQDVLSGLCGANDGNLRAIEKYLGAPLFTRGNELTIASSDKLICRKFQTLIDKLISSPECDNANSEKINALLAGLDSYIQIPQSTRRIYPKSPRQAEFIHAMGCNSVVFCLGPAGTGKTFLAIAEALRLVLSREVKKIVLTRPVVEAGENLGFLPGDLEQKISPYLRPLYDAMESIAGTETVRRLEEARMLEVAPLAYMRGRSIDQAVVLLDEAQNTTREQMKMFLTRMGEGTKMIISGDPTQTDLPSRVHSGLSHAVSVLSGIPDIAIVRLEKGDVVRNPLVKKIVEAYENAH